MARPVLGGIELVLVQKIEIDGDQVLFSHSVPAMEGDFLQGLGSRARRMIIAGVLTGPEAGDGLKGLREKFMSAEPVPFVEDIATATKVDRVLIEEMGVREISGRPERFEYVFTLREFIQPLAVATEEMQEPDLNKTIDRESEEQFDKQIDEIAQNTGELQVQVVLEDGSRDFTDLVILVEGTTDAEENVYFVIEDQADGIYRRENVPAGNYDIRLIRR